VLGIWHPLVSPRPQVVRGGSKEKCERKWPCGRHSSSGGGLCRALHDVPLSAREGCDAGRSHAAIALERSNAKLAKENAQLRDRVNHIETAKPAVGATASAPKGNPVQHAGVAASPAPAPEPEPAAPKLSAAKAVAAAAQAFSDRRRSDGLAA